MLDHDALSFSLVPFCYGVCPFVNQLHPLPSATSGIPAITYTNSVCFGHLMFIFCLYFPIVPFTTILEAKIGKKSILVRWDKY
jgi:hypothetical protein